MRKALSLTTVTLTLFALAAGCGSEPRLPLRGTVTQSGAPVAIGTVTFVPSESDEGDEHIAAIRQGSFEFKAPEGPAPGKYKILVAGLLLQTPGSPVPKDKSRLLVSGEFDRTLDPSTQSIELDLPPAAPARR